MRDTIDFFLGMNDIHWNGSPFQWFFYAAILLTLFLERRRLVRIAFGWVPLLYLVGVFTPLCVRLLESAGVFNTLYFARLFSFMPLMYVIALGMCLLLRMKNHWFKLCAAGALCAAVCLTGSSIYDQPWFTRAENLEKVPADTLEVLEAIDASGGQTASIAAVGANSVYLRQVADVVMPYGRYANDLGKLLKADPPDVQKAMQLAGQQDVDYIAVNRTEATVSAFAEKGYEPVALTTGTAVYRVAGVPRVERTFNDRRQVVSLTHYDAVGNAQKTAEGYITVAYSYHDRGSRVLEYYLDENGAKVFTKGGYAGVENTYYSLTSLVASTTYLDLEDRPVLLSGRYKTTYAYNINNKLIREAYFDQDGRPMNRTDVLYASREFSYDRRGRIVEERYYDVDGALTVGASGYAACRRVYDKGGNIKQVSYYDALGQLTFTAGGYASVYREYNDAGQVTREVCLDAEGAPIVASSGYAEVRRTYNDAGQMTSEGYWGASGEPLAMATGIHRFKRAYDAAGNVASEAYFDENDAPALYKGLFQRVERVYDGNRRVIRESYWNGGDPVVLADGFAAFAKSYDARGNVLTEAYFDASGAPVRRKSGFASVSREYDANNRVVRERYFDEGGQSTPCAAGYDEVRREYTPEGLLARESYWLGGEPANGATGAAVVERQYDAGTLSEETRWDRDGKLLDAG